MQACIKNAPKRTFADACLAQHHIASYSFAVYQPASRFWLFQGIEAGIFTALSLTLIGFTVWWIRKRLS